MESFFNDHRKKLLPGRSDFSRGVPSLIHTKVCIKAYKGGTMHFLPWIMLFAQNETLSFIADPCMIFPFFSNTRLSLISV